MPSNYYVPDLSSTHGPTPEPTPVQTAAPTPTPTQAPNDSTPDQFYFTDITGVELNTLVTSQPVSVTGINVAASISITGGEYRINSSQWTSQAGTVISGDTVTVRLTSSSGYSTKNSAVLTIGGVSDSFDVTTRSGEGTNVGDVNSDGSVDIIDALLVAQFYVGLNPQGFNIGNADTDCSGGVDIVDALLLAQYYVGLNPSGIDLVCGDVNHSGSIDIIDALLIAQYYVGLISSFP
jgi:hypothetical protein